MKAIRAINRLFTWLACALTLLVVAIVLQDVLRRYFLNDPTEWALDISSFLLVYIFFLALAPALERGNHVRVDFFEERVPPGWRPRMAVAAHLLVVIFGAVLFWQLYLTTEDAFVGNYLTSSPLPIRLKYIYAIGPVGAAQFVVTGLALLCGSVRELRTAAGPRTGAA